MVDKGGSMSKNPVVHFEMPYKDAKRVAEFYSKVFGWNMADTGEQMGHYVTAATAETDENRMVKTPGTINGGFYSLQMAPQSTAPSVVISVNDLQEAIKNIEAAGGKMLGEPQEIPGIGLWVSFTDSEGNRVSVLQAKNT
jgi:predicted enzyme related to lactoylglutathione lyase